jgi:tetratricopeptide (TPR) repeat protein
MARMPPTIRAGWAGCGRAGEGAPPAYVMAGWALTRLDRPADGLSYLERGVSAGENLGAKSKLAFAYLALAEGLLLAGRIQDAKGTADRALELAVASGERGNETGSLRILAEIAASEAPAALEPAFSFYERAKTLAQELGMRPLVAQCHFGLSKLYRRTGDTAKAKEHLTAATTMYRERRS